MKETTAGIVRVAASAAALAWLLLIPASAACAADIPEKYEPVKLAERITGKPGTVAWSPDGKRLAYIGEGVEIFDPEDGSNSSGEVKEPYFLVWRGADALMVLHEKGKLATVDAKTLASTDTDVPADTVAVYPSADGEHTIALTAWSRKLRFGVEVGYGVHAISPGGSPPVAVFNTSSILPLSYAGSEYLKGWMSAGPSPVLAELMLLRFIVPPNAPPYIKVLAIDASTGASREVLDRYREGRLRAWGAWSRLGGRAALTDDGGRLVLLSLSGGISTLDEEVRGMYPSWDPRGGRIFFGGYFIEEDGSGRTPVAPDEPESSAFFSPSGETMALASGGNLWLLKNIEPSKLTAEAPVADVKKKAALLKELYSEGFITELEYRERVSAIIGGK